jgi:hypothetical protein
VQRATTCQTPSPIPGYEDWPDTSGRQAGIPAMLPLPTGSPTFSVFRPQAPNPQRQHQLGKGGRRRHHLPAQLAVGLRPADQGVASVRLMPPAPCRAYSRCTATVEASSAARTGWCTCRTTTPQQWPRGTGAYSASSWSGRHAITVEMQAEAADYLLSSARSAPTGLR